MVFRQELTVAAQEQVLQAFESRHQYGGARKPIKLLFRPCTLIPSVGVLRLGRAKEISTAFFNDDHQSPAWKIAKKTDDPSARSSRPWPSASSSSCSSTRAIRSFKSKAPASTSFADTNSSNFASNTTADLVTQFEDGTFFSDRKEKGAPRFTVEQTELKTKDDVDKKYAEEKEKLGSTESDKLDDAYKMAFIPFPDNNSGDNGLERPELLAEQERILGSEDPVTILSTKKNDLESDEIGFRNLEETDPNKQQHAARSLFELRKRWNPDFLHGDDRVIKKVEASYRVLFPNDENPEEPEPLSKEEKDDFPEMEWADARNVPRRGFVPPEFIADLEKIGKNIMRDVESLQKEAKEALDRAQQSFAHHRDLMKRGLGGYMTPTDFDDPNGVTSPYAVPKRFLLQDSPLFRKQLGPEGVTTGAKDNAAEGQWQNSFRAKSYMEML
ncbi:unnamed protein product [Amoebophrya sp. A120]|nr:unnamed protein product [Amoebophrya sp. A120]|eukprot:GSA120T00008239001.1